MKRTYSTAELLGRHNVPEGIYKPVRHDRTDIRAIVVKIDELKNVLYMDRQVLEPLTDDHECSWERADEQLEMKVLPHET